MSNKPETEEVYRVMGLLAEITRLHGVRNAILCPGSRSAPIALSFMRNKGIKTYTLTDERSAAYTALGIARQLQEPVVLVCTSGTAALNFAPAAAEAFFSEIPLIVFTADRPPEWIAQADNQSIYQQSIYGKNIKAAAGLPVSYSTKDDKWYAQRLVNEMIVMACTPPFGPVHINIPLREPLYLENEVETKEKPIFIERETSVINSNSNSFQNIVEKANQFEKILVVAGNHSPDKELTETLSKLTEEKKIVLIADIASNQLFTKRAIRFGDTIAKDALSAKNEEFVPDLVISFGGPLVSKSGKDLLRQPPVKAHWHITEAMQAPDTFQKLSKVIPANPASFFKALAAVPKRTSDTFAAHWNNAEELALQKAKNNFSGSAFSEIKAVYHILQHLPENSNLHLGNSLPVRHVTSSPLFNKKVNIYSNRGTSGIDGTVSAAAGHSMVSDEMHTLICGDLAFMYDNNGLWNNNLKDNLKIIILNNHGGQIFRSLPGAAKQKEIDDYFVTHQPLKFEHTALQHGCHYMHCDNETDLLACLDKLYANKGRPVVLEIEC